MLFSERWISLSVHCFIALYMFSKLLGSTSNISYLSKKPRDCFLKHGIHSRPEQFIRLFPYVANRCAPSHHHMKISRFGDEEEWRYSMLPGRNVEKNLHPYWAFVFVGFSKNLSVELQIKRTLYCKCEFIGINNRIIPDALRFTKEVGDFYHLQIGVSENVTHTSLPGLLSRKRGLRVLEHLFITELDDMYTFLPELLHKRSFENNYVTPCQVTLDLPLPNTYELSLFMHFTKLMLEQGKYTILSVETTKTIMRLYVLDPTESTCIERYQ